MPPPVTKPCIRVPVEPVPPELAGYDFQNPKGNLAVPLKGSIASAPAPFGGRVAQGGQGGEAPSMYPALGTDTQKNTLYDGELMHGSAYARPCIESEKSWAIPGTTAQKDLNCGTIIKWIACRVDPSHWKRPLVEHCDRVECPECWTYWAIKQSKRMADKLRGYVADAKEHLIGFDWHKINAQNLRHWVFSPPEGTITPDMSYDKIKAIGKDFVLKWGVTGGVLVFHPWRIRDELQLLLILHGKISRLSKEEKEKKFWQMAREDVLKLGDWRQYCYWSPHYHVIGFGYVEDSRKLHSKTGWVYKLIRNVRVQKVRTPEGIDDEVAALCFYVISHAGYQWTKKIPAWFGCCTPANLKKNGDPVPSEFDGMNIRCPKCSSVVVEYKDDAGEIGEKKIGDDGEEIGQTIKDRIQRYQIQEEEWRYARRKRIRPGG